KQIAKDGEGATKVFEVFVTGAMSERSAEIAAKAVANSLLVKTAIFGFTVLMNILPDYKSLNEYVRKYSEEDLQAVREAKGKYDIVLVYIHWGQEYMKEPDNSQKEIAEKLAESGADVIIGGHPHILQPLELIVTSDRRIVPVVYSMGNFISNQSRNYYYPVSGADEGRTRDSAIMRFKVKKYAFQKMTFCIVSDLYFIPLWTHNNNLLFSKGIEKKLEIYVFPIAERIEELKNLIDKEKEEKRKTELLIELEHLINRLNIIKTTLGEDFVR
ncbi:MAG: bifunctional ornithine acetyltransferase/N-acetylglutamate synthase, partial [Deltaproteobacteria bacterium]|nr:bifunctional ornithine acetyltransferase/N-acetylglutamate synthase [Deltaproteobacteria bacterium]